MHSRMCLMRQLELIAMENVCQRCGIPISGIGDSCDHCRRLKPADLSHLTSLEGYLLMLPRAVGSKSESIIPHLVASSGSPLRLHVAGENPFAGSSLSGFHRQYVVVEGEWDARGNHFLVASCVPKECPWIP